MRINLPNNQWAELRSAEDLLEEDREAVIEAMAAAGDDLNRRTYAGRRQWLVRLITNWSFQQPIPSTEPKALSKIPMKAYDALGKQVNKVLEALGEDEDETPPVPSTSSEAGSGAAPSPTDSPNVG